MTALQVAALHLRRDTYDVSTACLKLSSVWENEVNSWSWIPKCDFAAIVVVLCRQQLLRELQTSTENESVPSLQRDTPDPSEEGAKTKGLRRLDPPVPFPFLTTH